MLLIFAFHPNHVKLEDIDSLANRIKEIKGFQVKFIPHWNNQAQPIYLITQVEVKD